NYVSADEKQPTDIMQKALEIVKRKEDRRRPNNDDRRDFRPNYKREDRDNKREPFKKEFKKEESVKIEKETVKPVKEEKVTVKKEKAVVKEDLTTKTVAELRELAKAKDVKGYSTMKKAELIDALK
ncbi:MAG TPA: Rho termination factor N-terminal domain-containing protein, partial [Bacilli bacterium]|nr:Rho termination factor N-terminal domain-containing protein [Bacilli bacterium]